MKYIKLFESDETYKDYPAAAKANAKMAIEWKEKYGRDEVKGGTAVGWARAHQLAKGEALSRDVVSRMAQFNRHRKNSKIAPEYKDEPWKDNGYIAWLIWGGDEGVDWAMNKMDEIKNESRHNMKHVKLFEEFSANKIICNNCGCSWRLEDGGNDMYVCHQCGHDNTPILGESYALKDLEDEFNIILDLYDNGKWLELSRIIVPKEARGSGVGSTIMQKVIEYADKNNKKIYLTPSKDFGATSTSRLKKFYKEFGFVKNEYKDESRESMVRFPRN